MGKLREVLEVKLLYYAITLDTALHWTQTHNEDVIKVVSTYKIHCTINLHCKTHTPSGQGLMKYVPIRVSSDDLPQWVRHPGDHSLPCEIFNSPLPAHFN